MNDPGFTPQALRVRAPGPSSRAGVADSIIAQPHPEPARYTTPPGTRYLLPCATLGLSGLFEYCLIDVAAARRWLLAGPVVSHVSHPLLKEALDRVIGLFTPVPSTEPLPVLSYHDDALVWQIETYETLWLQSRGDSRRIRDLVAAERFTLGLLKRLA